MYYQNPSIRTEKPALEPLSAQYELLVTPDCPTYFQRGLVIEGGFGIFCTDPQNTGGSTDTTAILICSNIEGEFELTVGDITPGGGLTCPDGEESFRQSYTTNIPGDCVIDQVLLDLGHGPVDICELVG